MRLADKAATATSTRWVCCVPNRLISQTLVTSAPTMAPTVFAA